MGGEDTQMNGAERKRGPKSKNSSAEAEDIGDVPEIFRGSEKVIRLPEQITIEKNRGDSSQASQKTSVGVRNEIKDIKNVITAAMKKMRRNNEELRKEINDLKTELKAERTNGKWRRKNL